MSYTIYTKPGCSYCDRAKDLLMQRGHSYTERELDVGQSKIQGKNYFPVQELKNLIPGVKTVPQIFHGDTLIGGFDDLKIYLG